jgi:hypothetical protein
VKWRVSTVALPVALSPIREIFPSFQIEFRELEVKYRPELPPVLRRISLAIPACARVGIAGTFRSPARTKKKKKKKKNFFFQSRAWTS